MRSTFIALTVFLQGVLCAPSANAKLRGSVSYSSEHSKVLPKENNEEHGGRRSHGKQLFPEEQLFSEEHIPNHYYEHKSLNKLESFDLNPKSGVEENSLFLMATPLTENFAKDSVQVDKLLERKDDDVDDSFFIFPVDRQEHVPVTQDQLPFQQQVFEPDQFSFPGYSIPIPEPQREISRLYEVPIEADDTETPEQSINVPVIEIPMEEASAKRKVIAPLPKQLVTSPNQPNQVATSAGKMGMGMLMPFQFDWGVQDADTGNLFSHNAFSDGATTQGQYSVLLPDGRYQVVRFFDEGNGFNVDISYEDPPSL